MLTEREVSMIIEDKNILEKVRILKDEFRKKEAPYLDISDHDFFSLILLMPSISIALANNKATLGEELSLNKKARKISRKSYFLKKDPVVSAMGFLIKSYKHWEPHFLDAIRIAVDKFIPMSTIIDEKTDVASMGKRDFELAVAKAPYLYIRMLISFFRLDENEDIHAKIKVSDTELETMKSVGKSLGFDKTAIFRKLLDIFAVK